MIERIIEQMKGLNMDTATIAKMLAGTVTRGVLWIFAFVAAKVGIESISQATAEAIGYFVASAIVTGLAMVWSAWKNKKLLNTPAPEQK